MNRKQALPTYIKTFQAWAKIRGLRNNGDSMRMFTHLVKREHAIVDCPDPGPRSEPVRIYKDGPAGWLKAANAVHEYEIMAQIEEETRP